MSKTTDGLNNIYDALARTDADIYVAHEDKRLYYSGKNFLVLRCDDVPPIPLIETENEAAAVMVLTGHFQAGG